MASVPIQQPEIIRTERGLTIAGTRISLYDVIDLLKVDYPPKLIRDTFNLTDLQIQVALSYIQANQSQIEAEYQEVLQTREEIRKYWEECNRERFARIAKTPHKPEQRAFWIKLKEQRSKRVAQHQ
jgi:uncharacterized protein (DUF433 family)